VTSMSNKEKRPVSLGERWRREAARNIDGERIERALTTLPHIRQSFVRVQPGSIRAEVEGAMGSIHETSIHVAPLPGRYWPQVARVMARSASMKDALQQGKVPRSFDRLIARICGEPLFPEPRRVSSACTCAEPDEPCHHILALQELFARRLDEKPWELLILRGVDLHGLFSLAAKGPGDDLPPLAYGAKEDPVLYPEGEEGDLDYTLNPVQVKQLLGQRAPRVEAAVAAKIQAFAEGETEPEGEPEDSAVVDG